MYVFFQAKLQNFLSVNFLKHNFMLIPLKFFMKRILQNVSNLNGLFAALNIESNASLLQ